MKIRTKVLLFFITPVVLAEIGISFYNSYENYNSIKRLSESNYLEQTQNIAVKIAKENENGVSISRAAAAAISMNFGERVENTSYIKNLLEKFPDFIGASVGYEVNADLNDFRAERALKNLRDGKELTDSNGLDSYDFKANKTLTPIDEWISKSESGRYAAYWTRARGDLVLEPLVGMDDSMYSYGLKKKLETGENEQFIITEPYLYNNKVLMVEFSSPILRDGKFMGQVAFDLDLSKISNIISNSREKKNSEFFLLSSLGRVISCTKNQNLRTISIEDLFLDASGNFITSFLKDDNGRLVRDENSAEIADLVKTGSFYRDTLKTVFDSSRNSVIIGGRDANISLFKDIRTNKKYYLAQVSIRPGNWVLVQVIPESVLLADANEMLFNQLLGVSIFILLILSIYILLNPIIKRIVVSCRIAEQVARGNLAVDTPQIEHTNDESGALLGTIGKMVNKLRVTANHIKETQVHVQNISKTNSADLQKTDGIIHSFNLCAKDFSTSIATITAKTAEINKISSEVLLAADATNDASFAQRGNLDELESSVSAISHSTGLVARRFSIINERLKSINNIVSSVSKVADETNLLSLNASIEAEKAGSYGVGFSVVAREIGRVSDQAGSVSNEIDTLARDMRATVVSGQAEVEKFIESVKMGLEDIFEMSKSLDVVSEKVAEMKSVASVLTKSIEAQSDSIIQIDSALTSLNSGITQTNSAINKAFENRKHLTDSMEKLNRAVSTFKLGNTNLD